VASAPLLVSSGGVALGITSLTGSGLALGSHAIKVTQASSGATKTATTALGATTAITAGVNDTIDVEIDGVAKTYTIAPGAAYTTSALATAITTASGGDLTVTVDDTDHLVFTTTDEGTAATLKITGGTALTDVGLTGAEVGGAASLGTDGVVDVDGTATTVSDVRSGQSVVLPSLTGGTVTAVLGGGLRVGTVKSKNVDIGDGTLNAVINAINTANVGVSASAIQVAPAQYKLQLASSATGLAGASTTGTGGLSFAGFATLGTAADAGITVGSGAGAFSITSSSNQVTNVLTGVSLNLVATGAATVTVSHDVDAIAAKVSSLVDQINTVFGEIKTQTSYDPETKQAGPLLGDYTVRTLQSKLTDAITNLVSTSTIGSAAGVGISIDRSGVFSFDKSKFVTAYNNDPSAVEALFQRGGTATNSNVSLALSTNRTRPGTYAVSITQAASQATATGAVVGGGTITGPETIDIRVGGASGTTITYGAAAGATLDSIADGINALAAAKNIGVLATVSGGALVLKSNGYGTSETFEVRSSDISAGQTGITVAANVFEPHAGTNVAGTIGGVAATGTGRLLTAPTTHATLGGLSLTIASTQAEVTGAGGTLNLGTFTYVPGVTQRIATTGNDAVDVVSGTLTTTVNGRKSLIDDLQKQIEKWDTRLAVREANLKKQFSAMETALSSMKQQSQWLAGQINSLSANNS
jgi:flagellar hook-associated protein 2